MKKSEDTIDQLIEKIAKSKNAGNFKKYVEYIRFPFYKNLVRDSRIDFTFPLTVLVGPNGSGKSSALHGIYGMPEGSSTGHFWFATDVDPIVDDEKNRHCFIYAYYNDVPELVEVIKTRIGTAKGSHYWEPSRPLKRYGMKLLPKGARNPTIEKKVVYLDFRSELSAYDKFFYFSKFKSTKTFKSKQDSIRIKSKHLKEAIDKNIERTYHNRKIHKPILLSDAGLKEVDKILGKKYVECKLVKHNLYAAEEGLTIHFRTDQIGYSEAFAGRGEFAVVKLVHEILQADDYSLVILDEPEVSLHPGAQERLLHFLLSQTLKKRLQVVLSTHSSKFVSHLPENAVKLFYPSDSIKFAIKNSCHYLEAFQYIGEDITDSDKKTIFVEDYLSKLLLDEMLKNLKNELSIMFLVKYVPGGAEALISRATTFSQEKEYSKFLLLDGDKRKDKKKFEDLTVSQANSIDDLENVIKDITGLSFKALKFSLDSDPTGDGQQKLEVMQEFVKFAYSNIDYLPENIPEDIIWDKVFATTLLSAEHKTHVFGTNNKENLKQFTVLFTSELSSETYHTCCRLFIGNFLRTKPKQYDLILQVLSTFKEL